MTKHTQKTDFTQASGNLKAALDLVTDGYYVIPLGPNKRPLVKGWQNKASDDARQVERWWAKWPDAMPGLPSGKRNGFTVLDIDQKNGKDGFAELKALGL
ncbi:MAG: bifunctional DNA primase/polymerase, partial [Sulfitobacter sp.]